MSRAIVNIAVVVLSLPALAGCSVTFGGGFPAGHHPGGDVSAAAQRRGEVRVGFPGPGQQQPPAQQQRREPVELGDYVRQQQQAR